jgi:hypothetical protein
MHLLESYALNCGLKINQPFIYEKIVPLPFNDYIVLNSGGSSDPKNYTYWQEVILLIKPYLDNKNIKIIQLLEKNEAQSLDTHGLNDLSFNQKAFVIKNSLLYAGNESMSMHLASHYDKDIVVLYSNTNPKNTGPFFNIKNSPEIIESPKNKPSYSNVEIPKTINRIKPEDIAKAILKKLNIKNNININTLYIGEAFQTSILEMVPDTLIDLKAFNTQFINVRMDYLFNEQILMNQLQLCKCAILTDKPINLAIYKNFKQNIVQTYFILSKDTDFDYLKELNKLNVNFNMISFLDKEETNKLKINTLEYGIISEVPLKSKIDIYNKFKDLPNLKIRSNKLLLSNNKVYPTFCHYKNNMSYISSNLESMDFIYDPLMAYDIDYFSIFQTT